MIALDITSRYLDMEFSIVSQIGLIHDANMRNDSCIISCSHEDPSHKPGYINERTCRTKSKSAQSNRNDPLGVTSICDSDRKR